MSINVNWDLAATIAAGIVVGHLTIMVVQAVLRTLSGK